MNSNILSVNQPCTSKTCFYPPPFLTEDANLYRVIQSFFHISGSSEVSFQAQKFLNAFELGPLVQFIAGKFLDVQNGLFLQGRDLLLGKNSECNFNWINTHSRILRYTSGDLSSKEPADMEGETGEPPAKIRKLTPPEELGDPPAQAAGQPSSEGEVDRPLPSNDEPQSEEQSSTDLAQNHFLDLAYLAALNGDVQAIHMLFQRGISVESLLSLLLPSGFSIPFHAAMHGHTQVIQTLIQAGVPAQFILDTTTIGGWSIAHSAAQYGRPEILQLLIDSGVSVQSLLALRSEETAIAHLAVMYGHPIVIAVLLRALLNEGASPDLLIEIEPGVDLIQYACRLGQTQIIKVFLDAGLSNHLLTSERNEFILEASGDGNVALFQFLIDSGISIESLVRVLEDTGWSALLVAAHNDQAALIQAFLDWGLSLNSLSEITIDGSNIAHIAASDGNTEIIQLLLNAYIKAGQRHFRCFLMRNQLGHTVYDSAAEARSIEIIRLLKSYGICEKTTFDPLKRNR